MVVCFPWCFFEIYGEDKEETRSGCLREGISSGERPVELWGISIETIASYHISLAKTMAPAPYSSLGISVERSLCAGVLLKASPQEDGDLLSSGVSLLQTQIFHQMSLVKQVALHQCPSFLRSLCGLWTTMTPWRPGWSPLLVAISNQLSD